MPTVHEMPIEARERRRYQFHNIAPVDALITVALFHDVGLEGAMDAGLRELYAEQVESNERSAWLSNWGVSTPVETVDDLARRAYPGVTFDPALPQAWVDSMFDRGFDVRGHFVMLYPAGKIAYVAPVTEEGVRMAATVATYAG